MDRGASNAAVHGVAEGQTQLSDFIFTFHLHALEKEIAIHSSVFAWRISGTWEPGRLPSMGSQRVEHDWSDLAAAAQCFNLLHLSLPKRFPLFILASSVCKSLHSLISALTQGGGGGHLFRLTCSVVLCRGKKTANKYHWRVWWVLAVSGPHWVYPRSRRVRFPSLHFSGSRLLCRVTV